MKMNQTLTFCAIIMTLILTACSEKVEAKFSPSSIFVDIGDTVYFENQTKKAVKFKWNFGDGRTSTERSPFISYSKSGSYGITLEAYSTKNKISTTTSNITVDEEQYRFMAKISGKDVMFTASEKTNKYEAITNFENNTYTLGSVRSFIAVIQRRYDTKPRIAIKFGKTPFPFGSGGVDVSQYPSIFIPKLYPYQKNDDLDNGIVIDYTDANGVKWFTDNNTSQIGSQFEFTSFVLKNGVWPASVPEFKAKFNCILYNNNGDTMRLTNGYMFARF
jgi:PKD repeat protein